MLPTAAQPPFGVPGPASNILGNNAYYEPNHHQMLQFYTPASTTPRPSQSLLRANQGYNHFNYEAALPPGIQPVLPQAVQPAVPAPSSVHNIAGNNPSLGPNGGLNQIIICVDDDVYNAITNKAAEQFNMEQSQLTPQNHTNSAKGKRKESRKRINKTGTVRRQNTGNKISEHQNNKDKTVFGIENAEDFEVVITENIIMRYDYEMQNHTINDKSLRDETNEIVNRLGDANSEMAELHCTTVQEERREGDVEDDVLWFEVEANLGPFQKENVSIDHKYTMPNIPSNRIETITETLKEKHMADDKNSESCIQNELKIDDSGDEPPDHRDGSRVFNWSPDFYTFRGKEETSIHSSHTKIAALDPYELFTAVWDKEIMGHIDQLTKAFFEDNYDLKVLYARLGVDSWKNVNVDELYTLFALLILGFTARMSVKDYNKSGLAALPVLGSKTWARFQILNTNLKFISKYILPKDALDDDKIDQVSLIVEHCNTKFQTLYVPQKYLSIDEGTAFSDKCSSTSQGNSANIDSDLKSYLKSDLKLYELCEAQTGYIIRCKLYSQHGNSSEGEINGFDRYKDKVVLKLMDDFLDVGYHLTMNDTFNHLPLIRYLKQRRTDVIGTINREAPHVPRDIRNLTDKTLPQHDYLAVHCGDISLAVWRDKKIECLLSTYHDDCVTETQQEGGYGVVKDFRDNMKGNALRDGMLLTYLKEPRDTPWHIKILRRLLNYTIWNMYIIRKKNLGEQVPLAREFYSFRNTVAEALIRRHSNIAHSVVSPDIPRNIATEENNIKISHIPDYLKNYAKATDRVNDMPTKRVCVQCLREDRRTMVDTICQQCDFSICLGSCWAKWHSGII